MNNSLTDSITVMIGSEQKKCPSVCRDEQANWNLSLFHMI